MHVKSIVTLLREHLEGTIGPEDKVDLDQWIGASEENRVFFQEINDPEKILASLRKMEQYDETRIWKKVRVLQPGDGRTIRLGSRRWIRYAAAIALLIGIGSYYLRQLKTQHPTETHVLADVAPGGNRAVLTLANGQKVILDSLANGVIAQQGKTSVDKISGSGLAYKVDNKGTELPGPVLFNTLTTPRGGQYTLRLSDGSRIWLDAASSITYPTVFTGKERRVKITGQAYLEIAHNAARPFITEVNGMEIKDIGTAFNINAYDDEASARITLVTGAVAVGVRAQSVVLQPGEQFVHTGNKGQVIDHADLDEVLAWKNGKFLFGGKTDIATIMRQLARWYDVDVKYEGQVQVHFGGSISRQVNVSKVLEKLAMTGEVKFRIEGRSIIVTP